MRVLICGDRNWNNFEKIKEVLDILPADTIIIHGDARGADKIAGQLAKERGLEVIPYPADWDKYKKAAGPIRNMQMLKEGKPELVIAFHEDITKSKGTKHMVSIATKAGVPVEIIS